MSESGGEKSDGEIKRKRMFDVYSDNLKLLIHEGILTETNPKYESTYICPICLVHFGEVDLDQSLPNPLTLEDAPPKSLGGRAAVLTCKKCNNTCGSDVDYHLSQQMTEIDRREFRPGIEFDAHFEKDGRKIQGRVSVTIDGEIQVIHTRKNNHPQKLEDHVISTPKGSGVQILFKKSKVEPSKIQLALLKTGYLLTFAKYGYAFILDPIYDRIRKQLFEPDSLSYPLDFWFNAPFPKDVIGVPFVTEVGLESILCTFTLKTEFSERMFSTIIPLTTKPIETVIGELRKRFAVESSFTASLDLMKGTNYLSDIGAIRKMLGWIHSKSLQ
jgi:hypothetical protein